jgi:uncharacterized RDD family membrane protein YckC
MKSKFQPDIDSRLIDPEAYDASEQRFAASVEEKAGRPRFVAETRQESSSDLQAWDTSSQVGGAERTTVDSDSIGPPEPVAQSPSLPSEPHRPQDSDAWHHEVTARLNNYRARRRPRAPRYPSLQLKFDPPETSWNAEPAAMQPAPAESASRLTVATQDALVVPREDQSLQRETDDASPLDAGARILEFPRSAASPPPVFYELAEPVLDRPRILEAPELVLPPPALGGILIEPVEEPEKERRPGFELPLQTSAMSRRVSASAIDGLLVISACALFAYIFFRLTSIAPPFQQTAEVSVILATLLWSAYQYLLLVYTGTTPGLKLAGLELSRFDGSAVPRRIRRWRVLASVLSGLSLALGYAWCFLDEDRLCWHDRITQTYMAPKPHPPRPQVP